jgi:hypothetical protein
MEPEESAKKEKKPKKITAKKKAVKKEPVVDLELEELKKKYFSLLRIEDANPKKTDITVKLDILERKIREKQKNA